MRCCWGGCNRRLNSYSSVLGRIILHVNSMASQLGQSVDSTCTGIASWPMSKRNQNKDLSSMASTQAHDTAHYAPPRVCSTCNQAKSRTYGGACLLALGTGPRRFARHSGALCSVRQQPTGSCGRLQGWGKVELAVIGPQEPAVNFTAVLCSPRM